MPRAESDAPDRRSVTRADFTATNERLYDQYIPVHFVPGGVTR